MAELKKKLNSSVEESELSSLKKAKDEKVVEEQPVEEAPVEEAPAEAEVQPTANVVLSPDGSVQAANASAQVTVDPSKTVEIAITEKKEVEEEVPPVEEAEPVKEEKAAPEAQEEVPAEEPAPEAGAEPRVVVSLPTDGSLAVQSAGKEVTVDAEGNTQVAITETSSRKISIKHKAIFEGRSLVLKESVKIISKSNGSGQQGGTNVIGNYVGGHNHVEGNNNNTGIDNHGSNNNFATEVKKSEQTVGKPTPVTVNVKQAPAQQPVQTAAPAPAAQRVPTQQGLTQKTAETVSSQIEKAKAARNADLAKKKAAVKKPGVKKVTRANGTQAYKPMDGTSRIYQSKNGRVYKNKIVKSKSGTYAYNTDPNSGYTVKTKLVPTGTNVREQAELLLNVLGCSLTEEAILTVQECLNSGKDFELIGQMFPTSLLEKFARDDLQLKEASLGTFTTKSHDVDTVCKELLEFYSGYAYDRDVFTTEIFKACSSDNDGADKLIALKEEINDVLDVLEIEIGGCSLAMEEAAELAAKPVVEEKPEPRQIRENRHADTLLKSFLEEDCGAGKELFVSLTEDTKVDSLKEIAKELLTVISNKLDQIDSSVADKSRGDIKQLKDLPSIQDAITKIEAMIERDENALPQYGQFINTVIKSILFVNQYSAVFKDAYRNKKTIMILKYENLILSIISCVSYFLSTVVAYKGENISLKDNVPDGFLEFAPLAALTAFNRSVESGEFKIIANDVSLLREYYLEVPVETMGAILEGTDYLPMIVNGVRSLIGDVDTTKLTNLLYKAAGVVILLFSLRDTFYTLFRMKTKVSEMLANIGLFSGLNDGGNALNKLSTFASKFKTDAAVSSDLSKREIDDENRKLLGQIKMSQSSPVTASKADIAPVADRKAAVAEPEKSDLFFGFDF